MLDRKFKSDVIFGYATQTGIVASSFLFMLMVTRFGSLETYGALMLLVSVSSTIGNLISFRTNEALVAFYKQGEATNDWGRCKFAIFASMFLDLLVGSALYAILYFNDRYIATLLLKDPAATGEVALYGYVILFSALKSTPFAYLQATERIKIVNAVTLAEQLGKLFIVVGLSFSSGNVSLRSVVIATLLPALCAMVIVYLPLAKALSTHLRHVATNWERDLTRDYARFSLSTFTSSALKAGNQNLDTLILGLATDTRVAGIYSTFRQFLSPFVFMTAPFEAIAYPRFVKAVVEGQNAKVRETILSINSKILFLFGAGAAAIIPMMIIYAQMTSLQLEGSSYIAFGFMLAAALLRGQLWWARPFSNAVNPNLSLTANFGATMLLLIALYPLILVFGLAGTALTILGLSLFLTSYWARALARYV